MAWIDQRSSDKIVRKSGTSSESKGLNYAQCRTRQRTTREPEKATHGNNELWNVRGFIFRKVRNIHRRLLLREGVRRGHITQRDVTACKKDGMDDADTLLPKTAR